MIELQGIPFDNLKKLVKAGHISDVTITGNIGGFRLFFKRTDLELLIDPNGTPVLFNTKPIYRYSDGQLINADGQPVVTLTDPQRQIYMNDHGELIDQDKQSIEKNMFSTNENKTEPVKCVLISSNSNNVRIIKNPSTWVTTIKNLGIDDGCVDLEEWDID